MMITHISLFYTDLSFLHLCINIIILFYPITISAFWPNDYFM